MTSVKRQDLNCGAKNKLDIMSGLPHRVGEVNQLNKLINGLGLKDGRRTFHPSEKALPLGKFNRFLASRLDHCFILETALSSCASCNHVTISASDHKAVVMELYD